MTSAIPDDGLLLTVEVERVRRARDPFPARIRLTPSGEAPPGGAPEVDLVVFCPGARVAPASVRIAMPLGAPFEHVATITPLREGALRLVAELTVRGDPVERLELDLGPAASSD